MAIRDKITVSPKGGQKVVVEAKRPGGVVSAETWGNLLKVVEATRTGKELSWTAFAMDEIKSIKFERG